MFIKETSEKAYSLYLIIGVISFLLISFDLILDYIPNIQFVFEISPFWQSIFVAWMFIGHLLYFKSITETKEIFNIEQVLSYIWLFGLFALPLNYIPEILSYFNFTWFPTSLESTIVNLLRVYSLTIYFLIGLVLFRKLVFVKKTKSTILRWEIFLILLIAATVVKPFKTLFDFEFNDIFYYVIIGIGFISILSLIFQLKWVAILSYKGKLRCIFFLLMINTISLLLIVKLLKVFDNYIIDSNNIQNIFLIFVICFVAVYGITSMLALLFNLPVASVTDQQKNEIESFQEISQIINNRVEMHEILELLFNSCITNTHAEGGWLTYKIDIKSGKKKTLKSINVSDEEISSIDDIINKHNIIYPEMPIGYAYTPNMRKNERFTKIISSYKSLVVCPIIIDQIIIGKMVLLKTYKSGFDEYMIKLALTYIDQAKIAIENTKLLNKMVGTERLKEELEIAEKIQKSLLATDFPENDYCQISAYSESAKEVGGDYYDFHVIDDNSSAVVIGDVSGKGTSAAFHMAELKGIFQALMQDNLSPKDFMIRTNSALNYCLEKKLFITLSYFVINGQKKKMTYSRAGHCPVLYYSKEKNATFFFEDEGIGLGIIRTDQFKKFISVYDRTFKKDDILLLYSDGIIEARNPTSGEDYGYNRLEKCLQEKHTLNAKEIKNSIIDDLNIFLQGAEQIDDVTLLVIKFL